MNGNNNYITATYNVNEYGKGFMVDLVYIIHENLTEVWLYHRDCGIKWMMFGVHDRANIISLVKDNLASHIETYKKKFMD